MSRLMPERETSLSRLAEDEGRGRALAERPRFEAPSSGLLVAGLVAAGVLGALAWYYLGPDLRRYLKIRNM